MADGIGNRMKALREEKGWTQAHLAELTGVSRKTVNTVENGVFIPSVTVALKLAKVFETPVESVFWLEPD